MGPKDVLKLTLASSERIIGCYLGDLTDADLLVVPIEGLNPVALQVGHLISAERRFIELISPGSAPALPEGFADNHSLKTLPADRSGFLTKAEYLQLWDSQRTKVKSLLETVSDSELDDTRDGKLPPHAPTIGGVFNAVAVHPLMHAGQFVAVRRSLKKPIAF